MKVMISLPMAGVSDEKIKERITELKKEFAKFHIEVVDSFINEEIKDSNHPGVYYLGRTLMNFLHNVDAVYFDGDWINARGCRIEHAICQEYGIKILDSNFLSIPEVTVIHETPKPPFVNNQPKFQLLRNNINMKNEVGDDDV